MINKEIRDNTVHNPVDDISLGALPAFTNDLHSQSLRNLHVTIQVLDEKTKEVIEVIHGFAESGNINVDGDSLVRRTGSIKLIATDDLFIKPDSLLWFNRIIRVYIGLGDNAKQGEVTNYLAGTYWIEQGSYIIGESGESITISLMDKMFKWDDMELESPLVIESGIPIDQAIRILMEHVGETDFGEIVKSENTEVVPYKLEYSTGESITSIITALRDMYMEYNCYYNLKGEFEFSKFKSQREYDLPEPKWRFDTTDSVIRTLLDFSEVYNLRDIRNRVVVYGGTSERSGLSSFAEARVTDVSSPFNIYAIGEKTRILVEDTLSTNEQCMSRAKYEVQKESTFKEVCTIKTIPLYMLDINDVIVVRHPRTGIESKYIVDSFDYGLSFDSQMTITAHKAYYVTLEYGEEKSPLVEAIIRGIANWGWLSLSEERISQCFNMVASGTATLNVIFQDIVSGGEQASITSYSTTKNQTLTIDLADFEQLILTDENGAVEDRSKGDYLDRVLGHEMFHAVSNDFLGHNNTILYPLWFKEGFSEFIHGGKERFLAAYHGQSQTEKKNSLIALAESLLDGNFNGTSEDYVASYLIAIAIYRIAKPKGLWTNLFTNMRNQTSPGINFLSKFLPIGSESEVKTLVMNELKSMTSIWTMLFNVNETDTGSVGGYYFMNLYNTRLTAESVFNNANSTVDSVGFKLAYIK